MISHVARLYALAASILALFLAWVGVAAAPWKADPPAPAAAEDPAAAAALARYEKRLRQDARLVQRILEKRNREQAAPPPTVRIVTAPPVATTRTS
jgi:hypothetical protein